MRFGLLLLFLAALACQGCRGRDAKAAETAPTKRKEIPSPYKEWPSAVVASWPQDTIANPAPSKAVDYVASAKFEDDVARLPSVYKAPEWAKVQSDGISLASPAGAKISYHLMPRIKKLVADENTRLKELLSGKKREKEELVIAKPWIGWAGQAVGEGSSGDYVVRIYYLFTPEESLYLSVEWPFGNKDAAEQAETMTEYIVHTVRPQ